MTAQSIEYTIERKKKGSRTFFIPKVNGIRLNSTNWARLYDARSLIKWFDGEYSDAKILEMVAAKAAA